MVLLFFYSLKEEEKKMSKPVLHNETDKRNCSFCGEYADDDLSIVHRQCGARTHADCLPTGKAINYKLCSICTGENIALSDVASIDVTPPSGSQGSGREPFPPDGVDYVLNPGIKKQLAGGGTWQMVSGLFTKPKTVVPQDVKTSQDAEFLLKNRVPVRDMLRYNKLGLQHLLKSGVDMTDFLSNGYTWNDLLLYEDIGRKGATRSKQALVGLGCTANHFRDYPDALPFSKVAAHAQLLPYDLCTHFGLEFPVDPPGALQCMGDDRWTARDCVRLGLKMDNLRDFGLNILQQYQDLMVGLSRPDAEAAERDLQVTADHIGELIDVEAPKPKEDVPAKVVVAVTPPKVVRPLPVKQTVEEQSVRHSPLPVAAATAPQPRAIVVIQKQQPAVATRVVSFQPNGKNKFDRHGALVRNVIIK